MKSLLDRLTRLHRKKYRYRPLADREIRLCQFSPPDQKFRIKCALEHFSIEALPAYTCLSYCWGNDDSRQVIYVDGCELPVGTNLYAFLVRYAGVDKYIWIDQICIDQASIPTHNGRDSEKSHQVSMMSQVYENALQVRVWLGEAADDSDLAINYLRRVLHSQGDGGHRPTDKEARPLFQFFDRPYWLRVWIVQELCLAKSLLLCCGCDTSRWKGTVTADQANRIYDAIKLTLEERGLFARAKIEHDAVQSATRVKKNLLLFIYHSAIHNSSSGLHLSTALNMTAGRFATVEHDRVYGILGLVEEKQRMVVDYDISIEELLLRSAAQVAKFEDLWADGDELEACEALMHLISRFGFNFSEAAMIKLLDRSGAKFQETDKTDDAYEPLLKVVADFTGETGLPEQQQQRWVSFLLHLPWGQGKRARTSFEHSAAANALRTQ